MIRKNGACGYIAGKCKLNTHSNMKCDDRFLYVIMILFNILYLINIPHANIC